MKDSHLEAIRDLWERSLTAETIAESLDCISADEDVTIALKMMKTHHYDDLGVKDKKGRISLYLEKSKINPVIMGILNLSPESPVSQSIVSVKKAKERAETARAKECKTRLDKSRFVESVKLQNIEGTLCKHLEAIIKV